MIHKVDLGMPTLIECRGIEDNIALCRELQLDFIELNMNLPQFQVECINPINYRRHMKDHNIYFTLHLPENLDICDFNPRVREAYLETVLHSIQIAREIGAPLLNMHMNPGVYFKLPDRKTYLYDEYLSYYLENIRKFGQKVQDTIEDDDVCICIENTGILDRAFIQKAVMELLGFKCFKLTWDIGHDHSSGCRDTEFLLHFSQHLRHFHIHDAIGENNHLPLGAGEITIQDRLDTAVRNHCSCVIETKTIQGLRESIQVIQRGQYDI